MSWPPALGAALGGSRAPLTSCPDQVLRAADAAALRSLSAELASRRVRSLAVITDDSPRSAAAARVVAEVGRQLGVTVTRRLPGGVDQGGLSSADAVLLGRRSPYDRPSASARVGRAVPRYGTYFAPWLLDGQLVSAAGGFALAALPFDPSSDDVLGPI